jgi:hypothetical protein
MDLEFVSRICVRIIIVAAVWQWFFFIACWRGNYVGSASPLAQVDGAAAVAAEREIGIGTLYYFLANWTAKFKR